MNNFNFEEVKTNEASESKYLLQGVHDVKIIDVEYKSLTGGYTGDAWDISFKTDEGLSTSVRLFPFKYNDNLDKYVKGEKAGKQTEAEQWESYRSRIKHIFTKALGEENFLKAMKNVKDVPGMFKNLKNGVEKVGQKFSIMIITDKNGYANLPTNWNGGYCTLLESKSLLEATYLKNITKYGPQSKPKSGFEAPSTSGSDVLDFFTSGPSAADNKAIADTIAAEEDSDLPF